MSDSGSDVSGNGDADRDRHMMDRASFTCMVGKYRPEQLLFCNSARFNARNKRFSFMAAIALDEIVASSSRRERITREAFLAYLEYEVLPHMNKYPMERSVLVVDKVWKLRRSDKLCRLMELRGLKLLKTLPDVPEYRPDEKAFALIKHRLSRDREVASFTTDSDIILAAERAIRSSCGESILRALFFNSGFF